jgi:hypothetical protein
MFVKNLIRFFYNSIIFASFCFFGLDLLVLPILFLNSCYSDFFSNKLDIFYWFVLIIPGFFLCFAFSRAIKITNFFSQYIF